MDSHKIAELQMEIRELADFMKEIQATFTALLEKIDQPAIDDVPAMDATDGDDTPTGDANINDTPAATPLTVAMLSDERANGNHVKLDDLLDDAPTTGATDDNGASQGAADVVPSEDL